MADGFLVDGFCHSSVLEARLHIADKTRPWNQQFEFDSTAASGSAFNPFFFSVPDLNEYGGDPEAVGMGFWYYDVGANDFSLIGGDAVQIWRCDEEFIDGPMPWGIVSSEGSGVLAFELTPELTAALILAALPIYAIAWCLRVGRGLA